jgi:hypothetical protein
MNKSSQALEVALTAVEQLSVKLRRQLVERLLAETGPGERTVAVSLRRLSAQKQARLAELMDQNGEGRLSKAEQTELGRLGAEVDEILLANSRQLARALRPELFDERGSPIKNRFRQALRNSVSRRAEPPQKHARA